ncbi:membrane protein [Bacillaceae bacterium JMAK1]|nr:membrane protein [Bacillaceae bacterium JMAK1]
MVEITQLLKDWRLHVIVLGIVLITEAIGIIEITIGPGMIVLLPMLFAIVFGLILYFTPVIKEKQSKNAEPIITIAVTLLIAKIGVTIGPDLANVIAAGPALLLQEIGNFGTIFLALPVAVLLLGMKRESIGMTHSIGRESNLGIIYDKYGFESAEGRGVTAIYVFGTVFGAMFYGLISGFLATFTPLHPLSLAMAAGVGSGSMMAAASGSLIAAYPELETQIIAFAGASNLLTYATGLFVSIFIALPITEKLYNLFWKWRGGENQ